MRGCLQMRVRTIQALLFVLMLSALAADMSVGCGQQSYVYGTVTQKFSYNGERGAVIAVNGQTYEVPEGFHSQVQVGDTVKFSSGHWEIVRAANQPAPSTTP
jgi:hypothetical protein